MAAFSKMTTYRKVLYVLSIILLVLAIIYLGLGIIALAVGSTSLISDAQLSQIAAAADMDGREALQLGATIMIVYGVWEALVSILGIRGAKNPHKMGLVTVIYGIEAAIVVCGLVVTLFTGNFTTDQFQGLLAIAAFFICLMVRKEARES